MDSGTSVRGLGGVLVVLAAMSCEGTSGPAPCAERGSICTWAGIGDPAFISDEMPALETAFYWPLDVEFAPDGRGYILDWQNHRVRRVDADGLVRTVVGTDEIGDGPAPGAGSEVTTPGVPGTSVNLNHPTDIQFAPDGTLFLAAWHNHKIRKFDVTTGLLHVSAGRVPGFSGDGLPASAQTTLMSMPKAIALSSAGDLYIADTRNFRIRRIAAVTTVDDGMVETVAGTSTRGGGGDGGGPLAAQFSFQKGLDQKLDQPGENGGDNPEPGGALAFDAQGRLYIADTENQRIRRIDFAAGVVETVAGNGTAGFSGDGGAATDAALNYPRDIEIGPDGRLFIADTDNHRIRAVDLISGVIDTVAGGGQAGEPTARPTPGQSLSLGDGRPAREATLNRPWGIGFDAAGDLYIADTRNNRVRRVVQP